MTTIAQLATKRKAAEASAKLINRTRKSKGQKEALWTLYKQVKGETPSRDEITQLSEDLGLKENQIYKWFWDTKKKVEEDTVLARKMSMSGRRPTTSSSAVSAKRSNNQAQTLLRSQKSLLRQASNVSNKSRECIGVDGKDGFGEQMTPQ